VLLILARWDVQESKLRSQSKSFNQPGWPDKKPSPESRTKGVLFCTYDASTTNCGVQKKMLKDLRNLSMEQKYIMSKRKVF
jgi:hypothetical protein